MFFIHFSPVFNVENEHQYTNYSWNEFSDQAIVDEQKNNLQQSFLKQENPMFPIS